MSSTNRPTSLDCASISCNSSLATTTTTSSSTNDHDDYELDRGDFHRANIWVDSSMVKTSGGDHSDNGMAWLTSSDETTSADNLRNNGSGSGKFGGGGGSVPFLPPWTLSLFSSSPGSRTDATTSSDRSKKFCTISNGLSSVPEEQLKESIRPILEELRSVNAMELLHLERIHPTSGARAGAIVEAGVYVQPIHELVDPPPSKERGTNIVRYIHLNEVPDQYSMGIFIFPPHAKIPLHDHPGMCVLSRILYGDIQRLSLDLATPDQHHGRADEKGGDGDGNSPLMSLGPSSAAGSFTTPNGGGRHLESATNPLSPRAATLFSRSSSPFSSLMDTDDAGANGTAYNGFEEAKQVQQNPKPPHPQAKRAFRPNPAGRDDAGGEGVRNGDNGLEILQAPAVTCLYPYEGNLHEFVAGPHGAAVLDVLLPPYDADHDRDCTFYDIIVDDPRSTTKSSCWIVPTGQPEDFHCISGRYRGLGSSN